MTLMDDLQGHLDSAIKAAEALASTIDSKTGTDLCDVLKSLLISADQTHDLLKEQLKNEEQEANQHPGGHGHHEQECAGTGVHHECDVHGRRRNNRRGSGSSAG